jgi:hypothetical protein
MKVCGFSFVRNAIKYGYPIKEAILSVLPLCDHFVVAVGNSEDGTLDYIKRIESDKIQIIETIWDDTLRVGGAVLAVETNKAFDAIQGEYDWCFYIQGDEVLHEKYHPVIHKEMERWRDHPEVEGLLLKYLHFWGSYDYVGNSRDWYRREIRIIRNDKAVRSYKDAQGFRKNDRKLNVKLIDAYMYHYGWVKSPAIMMDKIRDISKLWHDDAWIRDKYENLELFNYSEVNSIKLFDDMHPAVMQKRIDSLNWKVELDPKKVKFSIKGRILNFIEFTTGKRLFEYKNYQIV